MTNTLNKNPNLKLIRSFRLEENLNPDEIVARIIEEKKTTSPNRNYIVEVVRKEDGVYIEEYETRRNLLLD